MVDLLQLARHVVAWPTLALMALGLGLGSGVRHLAPDVFSATATWSAPSVTCAAAPGRPRPTEADAFSLPATMLGGPPDASIVCRLATAPAELRCRAIASAEPSAARALALLTAAVAFPQSAVRQHLAEVTSSPCLVTVPEGWHGDTVFRVATPPTNEAPRTRYPKAPVFGALAGAFASMFLAGWRSRRDPSPVQADEGLGLVAPLAVAGMMLTSSMSRILALDLGPFTVRFAQLCALVLFSVSVVQRLRRRQPLSVPFKPAAAALAYLALLALSAVFSENPSKSLGYLGWAGFDLLVVFCGLVLWTTTERRFRFVLRFWIAGMALAVLMGGIQLGAWFLGLPPPLVGWDLLGVPRINGFSTEPSYYALYIVPGTLFLLARAGRLGRSGLASFALATAFLAAAVASTSRSGWLGLVTGVAFLSLLLAIRAGRAAARRVIAFSAGALALGAVLITLSPALRDHVVRFARMGVDPNEASSSVPRLHSLAEAAALFRRHPVLGTGFGGYGAEAINHPFGMRVIEQDAFGSVTTNLYLEIAAETGVVGLSAALVLLGSILAPLLRRLIRPSLDESDEWAATCEGLLIASFVLFAVLFQFSQTLWRLDVWISLALSFSAGTLPAWGRRDVGASPSPALEPPLIASA